jgi:hypothetical protein
MVMGPVMSYRNRSQQRRFCHSESILSIPAMVSYVLGSLWSLIHLTFNFFPRGARIREGKVVPPTAAEYQLLSSLRLVFFLLAVWLLVTLVTDLLWVEGPKLARAITHILALLSMGLMTYGMHLAMHL